MVPAPHILNPRIAPADVRRLFQPLRSAIPHARFTHRPDHRRRVLDAASIIIALVFFQMRRLESLRALVDAFEAVPAMRRVLGIAAVRRSTLSDALSSRLRKKPDTRLRDFCQALFQSVVFQATRTLGRSHSVPRAFLAVDGTVFSATAKMIFAHFDDDHNAVKAHVAFDIQNSLPRFLTLTTAIESERDQLTKQLRRGNTYILDRGYLAFDLFHAIIDKRAYFVTRLKDRVQVEVERVLDVPQQEQDLGVLRHEIVLLDRGRLCLHRVVFRAEDGRIFEYLTNHANLTALEIADIYKSRWAVETFFKFLKYSLSTKHFISRTMLGFHIQLLAAAITYLLFAIQFGPHPNGRPPVTISQMRRLVDQLLAAMVRAVPSMERSLC